MKHFSWKLKIKDSFIHLLILLIASFLLLPLIMQYHNRYNFPVLSFAFLMSIIFTLRPLKLPQKTFFSVVAVGVVWYLCELLVNIFTTSSYREGMQIITSSIYGMFLSASIVLMLHKMFSTDEVTSDTILGGICIYFLLGIMWAIFYNIIYLVDHNAFHGPDTLTQGNIFYFSFITLTTVGFGDIYPVNSLARSLASLEAVIGQMYIAIFISRLVTLHLVHKSHK